MARAHVEPGAARGGAFGPLARYLLAATLARGADGGAAVGLVLLAVSPATGLRHGPAAGGLLAAALTAPHLLGPWVARRLDQAADGRRVLAVAFAAYGLALGGGTVALGRLPLAVAVAAVAVAGACGPLLTGGLSSRLAGIAKGDGRAEGWDAVTYGLAGTLGPALVAALAAATSALTAMAALAGSAIVAAAITLTLPRGAGPEVEAGEAMRAREALRAVVAYGPLRRVGLATVLTAASFGAIPVIAVVVAEELGAHAGAGASLVAAFGLGNLAGSAVVTAFPVRGEPELAATRLSVVMAAALALCAIAPSYATALGAFAVAGASNAPFFTATLTARSRYAPPGARAQVFVTVAGAKVAFASAGAALAGAVSGIGAAALLAVGAAITLAAAAATAVDRRMSGDHGALG